MNFGSGFVCGRKFKMPKDGIHPFKQRRITDGGGLRPGGVRESVRGEREGDGGVCEARGEGDCGRRVRGGSVVCTASRLASLGAEKGTDYTMSKHAVLGLVRCASLQLASCGIRVNAVSPGATMTPMLVGVFGANLEKGVQSMVSLKLGKVPSAENVADAVSFLASDESEFITGHDLAVDGGFIHPQSL
ncbi:Glucose/ribitol dehydrogenase [Trema orientale]|uniref:Glucose/ribitol dehydrogenase n=1 Tax=Trema orientale TaxID=63057 RepID=A0A2P5EKK0_TREOI|nr:Glucose/ribitol dehydrogenase [Trema orientale]